MVNFLLNQIVTVVILTREAENWKRFFVKLRGLIDYPPARQDAVIRWSHAIQTLTYRLLW